jgi:glutaredoxin
MGANLSQMENTNTDNNLNILGIIIIIILIIIIVYCWCNQKDSFSDDTILVFLMNGCGYCSKLKQSLEESNNKIGNYSVKQLDISTDEAQNALKNYNISSQGYPMLYCPKTKKQSFGYKSLDQYIKDLNLTNTSTSSLSPLSPLSSLSPPSSPSQLSPKSPKANRKTINDLDTNFNYIVGRTSCPFTVKMMDVLKKNNIEFEYIDIESENKDLAENIMVSLKSNSVPLTLLSNGRYIQGYTDDLSQYQ